MDNLIYAKTTTKDFSQALTDFKDNLSQRKFGVLWELNFKDKLQEKGQDFDKNFVILEVCNPPQAKKVLDLKLEAGYMLPCKMAIYEKDGVVHLGMMRPERLVELMGEADLVPVGAEVEKTLREAIDATV